MIQNLKGTIYIYIFIYIVSTSDRHRWNWPAPNRSDPSQAHRRCPARWSAAIWTNRRRPVRRAVAVLHSDEEPHRIGIYIYINTHTIIQHICINVHSFLFLCFSRLKKTQRSHESKCKEQEEEENSAGLKDRFSFRFWYIQSGTKTTSF